MRTIELSKQAGVFLRQLPSKHARQIIERLDLLAEDAEKLPSEILKGYAPMRRLRAGEYRIVFLVEGDVVQVRFIGKRNDDEIYKSLERSGRK
jgi:mRNA-degrading endonuclease RelE of RelBE toxin-antitoxin system